MIITFEFLQLVHYKVWSPILDYHTSVYALADRNTIASALPDTPVQFPLCPLRAPPEVTQAWTAFCGPYFHQFYMHVHTMGIMLF